MEEIEGHAHTDECRGLSEEEQAQVDAVIAMIDELPTYDEVAEKMDAFYESGDTEAEEEYFTWIGQTGLRAYNAYQELTEEQQSYVTNIDRLMDLSSIWSVATLEANSTISVYERNCYVASRKAMVISGGTLDEKLNPTPDTGNDDWRLIEVRKSWTGKLYVYYKTGTSNLKTFHNWRAPDGGFLLLVRTGYMDVDAELGDEVIVSGFDYLSGSGLHNGAEANAQSIGTVTFRSSLKTAKDNSSELTVVPGADTSSLIEVNLFDYTSAINTKYNANHNYLGFQQDYGTKDIFTAACCYASVRFRP